MNKTAESKPRLAYVALISRDIPAATHLLGDVLGLPHTDLATEDGPVPVFSVGHAALALFHPGDRFVDGHTRTGLHHIGLDHAGHPPPDMSAGNSRSGLGSSIRRPLPIAETVGVRTWITDPLDPPRDSGSLVERIDHLGIASIDNQAAITAFSSRIGLPVESQQTDIEVETAVESFISDTYGVVYHARKPRVIAGLRVAFLTAGDCELEFLQNLDPSHDARLLHGAAGDTRQDQGAITKFIASAGAGLHHIAFKTTDIDATLALLERLGARLIDCVGRPGSRRARIGFVHPANFGGVLVHFVERDEVSHRATMPSAATGP